MKTIQEAANEFYRNLHRAPTESIVLFAYCQGAQFAQRWIQFQDELPEIGIEIIVKKRTKTGDVKAIYTPLNNSYVNQLAEIYTHWRPIELK